jgi:hypothetical protein
MFSPQSVLFRVLREQQERGTENVTRLSFFASM